VDSLGGSPQPVPMDDVVEVGVFATEADVGAESQTTLYRGKHRLTGGKQTISVTVDEPPARAGVDPFTLLIDRETSDNLTSVTKGGE